MDSAIKPLKVYTHVQTQAVQKLYPLGGGGEGPHDTSYMSMDYVREYPRIGRQSIIMCFPFEEIILWGLSFFVYHHHHHNHRHTHHYGHHHRSGINFIAKYAKVTFFDIFMSLR